MIVRKEEYKVSDAAYLLDLPARSILALCDSGVIGCSRIVQNGAKKQRKKRSVKHEEIVRFNASRKEEFRSNLAARLTDPNSEQPCLPFAPEPDAPESDGTMAVWLSREEWRAVSALVGSVASKVAVIAVVAGRIGPGGDFVIKRGLRVRLNETEDVAA